MRTNFATSTRCTSSMRAARSSSTYDKVHLVPFGEYLPFRHVLERLGLQVLTSSSGGFDAGTRLRTLDIPNAPPVGVLVCYEAIFPGSVVDPGRRPGWLLNVTNDAWFGADAGPLPALPAGSRPRRSRKVCRWCGPPMTAFLR